MGTPPSPLKLYMMELGLLPASTAGAGVGAPQAPKLGKRRRRCEEQQAGSLLPRPAMGEGGYLNPPNP